MFSSLYVAVFLAVFFVKNTDCITASTCSSTGDPHYTTFDRRRYDFMGRCQYILAKDTGNNFVVLQDNEACNGGRPSCTKSLTVLVNGLHIQIDKGNRVSVDGQPTLINSVNVVRQGIRIYRAGRLVKVQADGLTVQYDGMYNVYVTLDDRYRGKTLGLCGNFNGNPNDDFIKRNNQLTNDARDFGNSWKVSSSCADPPAPGPHPCTGKPELSRYAKDVCLYLKKDPFTKCHRVVDPAQGTIQNCEYDVCACTKNHIACLCEEYAAYAEECRIVGVNIQDWRNHPGFQKCAQP